MVFDVEQLCKNGNQIKVKLISCIHSHNRVGWAELDEVCRGGSLGKGICHEKSCGLDNLAIFRDEL